MSDVQIIELISAPGMEVGHVESELLCTMQASTPTATYYNGEK